MKLISSETQKIITYTRCRLDGRQQADGWDVYVHIDAKKDAFFAFVSVITVVVIVDVQRCVASKAFVLY